MADLTDIGVIPAPLATPRPLVEVEVAAPYPVDALPPLIRDAIVEVAAWVQAPVALIAASALAAVSSAVQTRFSVRRDAALCGPATLYLLTVAESGERKSTVDKLFTGPIRDWEAEQRKLFRERMARFEAEKEDWERRGKILDDNIATGMLASLLGTDQDPRVLHAMAMPKEPKKIRILRGDDTPEALAMNLEHYPVASIISSEAGTIFGSHGMNPEAVTRNLAQANVLWDGGVIQRGRSGAGELQVEGMRVTMGLQVQPTVLDAFTQKTGGLAKGIGYFARFLFCQPESTQGTRSYKEPPPSEPARAAFCQRMATLLALEAVFDDYDRLAPEYVGFDEKAQRVWVNFYDEVEEQLQADEAYCDIRDVASKAADNAARLACCLHVFSGDTGPINYESMVGACRLMLWYLDEAVRFGRVAGTAPELADAKLLEEWLVREFERRLLTKDVTVTDTIISKNDVKRRGPNPLRQAHSRRLDDALDVLADHHRVTVTKRFGKKGVDIMVRPEVVMDYRRYEA